MVRDPYKRRLELLYLAALCLYLTLLFVNQTEFLILLSDAEQALIQKARYLCYLAFAAKILLTRSYSRRWLVFAAAGLAIAVLCAYESQNRRLIFTALAVLAAYEVDAGKILRCAGAVFGAGLAVTLGLCALGVLKNLVLDESRGRQNLGFNWVTLAPIYFLFVAMAWVHWRAGRASWPEYAVLLLVALWLYRATDTRMTFLLTVLFLAVSALEERVLRGRWSLLSAVGGWIWLAPFVIAGLVLLTQSLYDPLSPLWAKADSLLSQRLSLGAQSLSQLSVRPFGQQIQWNGFSLDAEFLKPKTGAVYNNVDSSYLRLLLDYGAAGLLLFLSLYAWGMRQAARAGDYPLVWIYLLVLLFCVTEQWLMELSFNYLPLAAGGVCPRPAAPGRDRRVRFFPAGEGGDAP